MHKLAIVALFGLTVSIASLGAAAGLGVAAARDNLAGDFPASNDRPDCEAVPGATATSRDLDWDGSDHVGLSVGGHASYTRGSGDRVHASGDPQLLAHLRVRRGNIELDCDNWHGDTGNLAITLPGREFKAFAIAGHGNLSLRNLDQAAVKVAIAGTGSIKADGKVERTDIAIAGSGNVDLGQVASRMANVHIAGSGDTDIAPSDEADIHIAGSGDVNLHSRPGKLETHIIGSGRIHNVNSGG